MPRDTEFFEIPINRKASASQISEPIQPIAQLVVREKLLVDSDEYVSLELEASEPKEDRNTKNAENFFQKLNNFQNSQQNTTGPWIPLKRVQKNKKTNSPLFKKIRPGPWIPIQSEMKTTF